MNNPALFLIQAFVSCATAVLAGVSVAAPTTLALSEAQRIAIERSPQIAAYDSTLRTARDATVVEQKAAASVDIARETALAWLECHYVEQMTRVADDQRKFAEVEVEASERMYWAGRVSQAEFYGARSMLAMLEDKWSELTHRSRAARIALKRWVGDAGDAPLGTLPNIDRIRLTAAGLEGDLARDPDIMLLEKQAEAATGDVSIVQADRRSAPGIAVKIANPNDARAARDEKLRAKVAEMRVLIDAWQHARDRRIRYARDVLPLARERTLATVVAYRGAKATLPDVLAARRAEIEAQMQSVEVERDVARLWAQINFVLPQ
jgi:outer membrane protein TolC